MANEVIVFGRAARISVQESFAKYVDIVLQLDQCGSQPVDMQRTAAGSWYV